MSWGFSKQSRLRMQAERNHQELVEATRVLLEFTNDVARALSYEAPRLASELRQMMQRFEWSDDIVLKVRAENLVKQLSQVAYTENVVWLPSRNEFLRWGNDQRPDAKTLHDLTFFLQFAAQDACSVIPMWERRLRSACLALAKVDDREVRELALSILAWPAARDADEHLETDDGK